MLLKDLELLEFHKHYLVPPPSLFSSLFIDFNPSPFTSPSVSTNVFPRAVVTVVMVRPTQPVPEVSGEATVCARKDIATAGPVDAIITTSPGKAAGKL